VRTEVARRFGAACACAIGALLSFPVPPAAAVPPALDVRAAVMIDAATGQQLYARNASQELAIASTTKLMTALVTLEHARLRQVFADPPFYPAAVDSQIGLEPGERMSVHDLLIAMMLPSADDAAEDLAYNVGGGSVQRFIAMMNLRARQLGLAHTHYSTPIGLDTPGNYSSASDLVALARFLLRTQPFLRRVVAMPSAVVRIGDDTQLLTNLNSLVGRVPWVNGVKTGHTIDAGYVLVGSGTRHGMTLISAVLGAPSEAARESDTLALLQYGFREFRLRRPVAAGATLARPYVAGRPNLRAQLIAESTFMRVFRRSTVVRSVVHAPALLTGPLRRHAILGTVIVLAGGVPVARIPLLLARAVPAPPPSLLASLGAGPFTLVVLGLLLGAGIVVTVSRQRRHRATRATNRRPA